MATLIIDPSLHVSSFPATYIGPGTLIGNTLQTGSLDTELHGYFTSVSGDAVQINCGFQPLEIDIVNSTDGITWHWQWGMPAADSVKFVLGGSLAGTLDTGGAITVSTDVAGDCTVTLSTTLCGAAKNICFKVAG